MDEWGFLEGCRYLIHDRDTKFTDAFRAIVKSSDVEPLKLPARSPNLNAYAERWVKSVKDDCTFSGVWAKITLYLFPFVARHNAFHKVVKQRHGEGGVTVIGTPYHATLD